MYLILQDMQQRGVRIPRPPKGDEFSGLFSPI
jgi:hypothetical protein